SYCRRSPLARSLFPITDAARLARPSLNARIERLGIERIAVPTGKPVPRRAARLLHAGLRDGWTAMRRRSGLRARLRGFHRTATARRSTLGYSAPGCIALRCIALECIALGCIALGCIALCYFGYVNLRCVTLGLNRNRREFRRRPERLRRQHRL